MNYPPTLGEISLVLAVIAGINGLIVWLLRRIVLSELNSWKQEMFTLIDARHNSFTEKYVSKELLGLQLQLISTKTDTLKLSVDNLVAKVERLSGHEN